MDIRDTIHFHGKEYGIDIPVLIIFFARPNVLEQTFAKVKEQRPSKLLLWQDGPRNGRKDDIENIMACRKIVENIDWECTVYRYYHKENIGCDPSTHLSHKWAFSLVSKCIILEDDVLFSPSFFQFCKTLLEKYETDERIDRICGHNVLGSYKSNEADYFFAKSGNSIGWATWRRVAEKWDSEYSFLNDKEALRLLRMAKPNKREHDKWLKTCKEKAATGKAFWEFIIGTETYLNNRLIIYPTVNMIAHIGFGENSTHYVTDTRLLSKSELDKLIEKTYDVIFPLKEPKYFVGDEDYIDLVSKKYYISLIKRIYGYLKRFIKRQYYKL